MGDLRVCRFCSSRFANPRTAATRSFGDERVVLLQSLPDWPRDKVLRIIDEHGNTLQEYGADQDRRLPRITVSRDEARSGNLLRTLLLRINEADTRVLLGDYNPVIEARMLALAKKMATHALKREANLFKSIYEHLESSTDSHVALVKTSYPTLPKSVIEHLLKHLSSLEKINFLDKGLIPPRLSEQITLTAKEVRLTRAYEGLYLGATATPDSERLMLHMLQSLPGWPASVRIEVRQHDVNGKLLDSIGAAQGGRSGILVKREGRYQAYSDEGQVLNADSATDNNLLSSILHVLDDAQRVAIGIHDVSDTHTLAGKISDQAFKDRANVKKLLGLEPPKPWFKPVMKVDRSFVVYPLTVTPVESIYSLNLIRKVKQLYPAFDGQAISRFLGELGGTEASRLAELERLKGEYATLQTQLASWETQMLYPTEGSHMTMALPGERHRVREQIERAWRRETEIVREQDGSEVGYSLNLYGMHTGDLPSVTADFSHIGLLEMDNMGLHRGSNEFLSQFTKVRWLSMSGNSLRTLPPAIGNMPELRSLNLMDNHIVLTRDSVQQLARCSALTRLHLTRNPLGLPPDVSQMTALRFLGLQRTGLTQWPIGVLGLTTLESLNLRDNQITTIPQAVFDVPEPASVNRATRIHGNPLSVESRNQLAAYWGRTGISLGYIPLVAAAHALALAEQRVGDVIPWLSEGFSAAQRAQRLMQWELLRGLGSAADNLLKLLAGLAEAQVQMSVQARQGLQNRVWALIDSLLADTALRDLLFQGVFYDATCRDGVMVLLDNLEVQVLIHEAEKLAGDSQREAQHFKLAKGLFRLREVDRLADAEVTRRMAAGGNPDVAEVQLFYRIALAEPLELPIQTRSMFHAEVAGVTTIQIMEAKNSILAMDGSPAFKHSIMHERLWRDFLQIKYADRFKAIEDAYQKDYEKLSSQSETLDEAFIQKGQALTQERDQKINRLVEELTNQAQRGGEEMEVTDL